MGGTPMPRGMPLNRSTYFGAMPKNQIAGCRKWAAQYSVWLTGIGGAAMNGENINRRQWLKLAGSSAAGLVVTPWISKVAWAADPTTQPARKILFFTKSVGYEHSVVKRPKDSPKELGFAEKIVTDFGAKNGFAVTCSKDGGLFTPESIASFDGFIFYTQGDLTSSKPLDGSPPMSPPGKQAFLDAVKNGKGFMGIHCGSDTFHSKGKIGAIMRDLDENGRDNFDPYIQMLGGEFIVHGAQQNSVLHCADADFAGAKALDNLSITEEWYSLKNFAPDLHVILAQDCTGMTGLMYQRDPYPETWARMHGSGRVFYTSMGHREDVWQRQAYQDLLLGAMNWITGRVNYDIPANIKQITPNADPKKF
jgi:uncharacterized protein